MHPDILEAAQRYRLSRKAEDALAVARKAREYQEWVECQSWYRSYLCAVPGDPEVIAEMRQTVALQACSEEAGQTINWVRLLGRELNWTDQHLIAPIDTLKLSLGSESEELIKSRIGALKNCFLEELRRHFGVQASESPWLAFLDWAEAQGNYDLAKDLLQYHPVSAERAGVIHELEYANYLIESFGLLYRGNSDEPCALLRLAVEQRNLPEVRRLTHILLQLDEPDEKDEPDEEDGGSAGLPARRPPPEPGAAGGYNSF